MMDGFPSMSLKITLMMVNFSRNLDFLCHMLPEITVRFTKKDSVKESNSFTSSQQ